MTDSEAIEIIEEYKGLFPNARNESESLDIAIKAIEWQKAFKKTYKGFPKDVDVACDIAIKALEKQIPKKPINNKHTVRISDTAVKIVDWWKCGKCNEDLTRQFVCCPYCQTVIDWSDTD